MKIEEKIEIYLHNQYDTTNEGFVGELLKDYKAIKKNFLEELIKILQDKEARENFKRINPKSDTSKIEKLLDKIVSHAKKGNIVRVFMAMDKLGKVIGKKGEESRKEYLNKIMKEIK